MHQRALAAAGAADDGDALPRQNVQGDVADGIRRAAVGKADVLQLDLAVQLGRFAGHGIAHALRAEHLMDAPGGDLCARIHDDGERGHDNAVHDHGDILDDGENVARAHAADAVDHAPAAEIDDEQGGDVQKQRGKRREQAHGHVGADDVLRHDMRGVRNAAVLALFRVERADDADAAQALAQQGVLHVDVVVGLAPQRQHALAQQHDDERQQRDKGQQHERKHDVLAHGQYHAAEEQHWDRCDRAGEHGGDPRHGVDIMRGARDKRGRAERAEFLKRERVDLAEHVRAQVGAEAGDDLGRQPRPAENAGEADGRNGQHLQAAHGDGRKIARGDAAVQNGGHPRRQQQIAQRRQRNEHRRGEQLPEIWLQIS